MLLICKRLDSLLAFDGLLDIPVEPADALLECGEVLLHSTSQNSDHPDRQRHDQQHHSHHHQVESGHDDKHRHDGDASGDHSRDGGGEELADSLDI